MSKMAAKSKKRLSKIENKLEKLEKLELNDIVCSICHSILIEPVTLPCYHDFCQRCFNGSIENNSLCCPLCRLRIGSWLRSATKQKNLVNLQLWDYIQNKFSNEIELKIKGEDLDLPEETPIPRLSAPGEIKLEYEAELKRLRSERLRLEQKHLAETELLIKKLQTEEEEAHKKYLEYVQQDEILAKEIQESNIKVPEPDRITNKCSKDKTKSTHIKPRLKARRIDAYLTKLQTPVKESPLLANDKTSHEGTSTRNSSIKSSNRHSPEILPNYGKLLKYFLDNKAKNGIGVWNKENGDSATKTIPVEGPSNNKEFDIPPDKSTAKSKSMMQSLLVSLPLPYTGILQHKNSTVENRNLETGSVDSMQQELCYFKPIDGSTPTSSNKTFPLRVPSIRAEQEKTPSQQKTPSRDQYVESLCRLRNLSLGQKLPSAFVIALSILRVKKETPRKTITRSQNRKNAVSPSITPEEFSVKKNVLNRHKHSNHVDGISTLNTEKYLRRTRSMGSISKDENEVTPKKKIKDRKVSSERKVYLRSYSKKPNTKREIDSPPLVTETVINNNKLNLAVKNLSSPLENCDVKNILREQLRIEKLIEQEKSDFELAQKMDAEWNGRRQLRRAAAKRQVSLNYALRPAKKLKV
ncbi:E3 ubiquitin-protein ligase rnf168-like [Battus philenor]|uniref:E3 ubiquitin-protein ligase rnf168-like n=1 Tax=Battus philenor TaxID=42288 RepID=UPI0035CEE287